MSLYIPESKDTSDVIKVECINIEKVFSFKKENVQYLTTDNKDEFLLFINYYNDAIRITEEDYNRILEII